MNFKTFAAFVGPSIVMMLLFIAFPLASVFKQSFYLTQPVFEQIEIETCTPGFPNQTCVTELKNRQKLDDAGNPVFETRYVGLQSYHNVLELPRVAAAFAARSWQEFQTIDFWKALRFTLTFTLITLPLVLIFGLLIALVINNATRSIRGPPTT